MKNCGFFRKWSIDDLLGELDDKQKRLLEDHLAACQDCASELAGMRQTLRAMTRQERTDPGDDFWEMYWDNLSGRMERERVTLTDSGTRQPERVRFPSFQILRPAYRWAAVVAALVAGIAIGRFLLTSQGPQEPAVAFRSAQPEDQSYRQAVDDRAEQYLERSKIFLLGFVNSNGDMRPGALDFGREKDISRGLVREASYLKENLTDRSQQKLKVLVEDLERILIEIANLEEEEDIPNVEMIKDGVGRSGILLKINVHQMTGGRDRDNPASAQKKDKTLI